MLLVLFGASGASGASGGAGRDDRMNGGKLSEGDEMAPCPNVHLEKRALARVGLVHLPCLWYLRYLPVVTYLLPV